MIMEDNRLSSLPQRQRNSMIDIISGLFIVEIVILHILQNSGLYEGSYFQKIVIRFFMVFMPWFYFKAGLMYKQTENKKNAIIRRSIKLMWPFLIWSIIGIIVMLPLYWINSDMHTYFWTIIADFYYAQGPFNTPLWFLPSLLFVYVSFYLGVFKDTWLNLLVLGVLSWLFCSIGFKMPLGLSNYPLGCFFFALGMRLQNIKIKMQVCFPIVFIYIFLNYFFYSPVNFRLNRLEGDSYLLYLIESTLLLIFLYILSYVKLECKLLEFLGVKSILFYVSHAPVIAFFRYLRENIYHSITNEIQLIIMSIGILLLFAILLISMGNVKYLFYPPDGMLCKINTQS